MTPTPPPDPARCPECGCGWWEPHRTGCSEPRFPAPSAPGEGTERPTPGPVEGRPGGWVDGIGWVVRSGDVQAGDEDQAAWPVRPGDPGTDHYVLAVVTRWADGTEPAPPPAPADAEEWSATPAAQHYDVWRVQVYREHHRVGAVEFMYEDDAIAFHALVNAARPAPAPTGERPDTDAIYDELMAQARKGCCDDRRRPCVYHDTYSDGIEAALYVIDRAGEVPRG